MSKVELRKHVAAVHCSGVLSLLERKIFNVLLLQAYDDLPTKAVHQIPVRLLCGLVGYDSNDWKPLKRALIGICTTAVEFNLLGDGGVEKKWTVAGMLAEATLEGGVCTYSYSPSMARELYSPEVYLRLNVLVQRQFGSSFSLAIYENCLRYRSVGSTGWWPLALFRRLAGAEAALYDNFRELRRRVVTIAVNEINEYSEIEVEPEFERAPTKGNPVTAIRFRITESKQRTLFPLTEDNDEVRNRPAFKLLRALGLSERGAMSAVLQDEDNAMAIAEYVRKGALSEKIKNPGAYAATLFERNAVVKPAPIEKEIRKRREVSSARPRPLGVRERQQLKLRFESQRREQAGKMMTEATKAAMVMEWASFERATGNASALRGYDEATGALAIPASRMFEIYATNKLLGEYTEADFEAYVALVTQVLPGET